MPSISQTIATLQTRGLDLTDSRLLLLHALGQPRAGRAWLLAHDTDMVSEAVNTSLQGYVARRLAGEPVAYIVGHKEFYGLNLQVNSDVLVPRPDTETLVDWALDVLEPTPDARVVDLGTGSGAIALALKATRPALQVEAVDYSHAALAVAQANAQRLGLAVTFSQGSWLSGTQGVFQAIVSNPPYIREDDEHLPALRFEPRQALTAGNDGLNDIHTIIDQAKTRLQPGGWLLLEHGYDQAADVRALLEAAGFANVQSRQDLAGIERCSGGQWTAPDL
ncbi:peptide chain release factor N(5)-glutamine methyltransferase [Rhodoferax sp. TBRC 17198]|uniref:peptide chain release factor N(5)-glutamine methyltransferase n=1 Tax=Rhodoferax potami TaxID=3068338 RepID=UPI0028BD3D24|nr:peptide chain release factor N(5)-glutamine methyltransferase [Rhodoferax sp. TBRC 17198]MDT7522933.1 peptide chain release factor N(5)-glutamine methyltransferase [Rhodoferax sp. TBRC 17198]